MANQFDAGIRLEGRIDRDMIAVRVGPPMCNAVAGSPGYFAKHPKPRVPQDLRDHNCLGARLSHGGILPWRFGKADKIFEIPIASNLVVNDLELMIAAAVAGAGLIRLPRDYLEPYFADGRLLPALEDWSPLRGSWYLYYPSRRRIPAPLQAVIDFLPMDKKAASAAKPKTGAAA